MITDMLLSVSFVSLVSCTFYVSAVIQVGV